MPWENIETALRKRENRIRYDDLNINYKSFGNPGYRPSEFYHMRYSFDIEINFRENSEKMKDLVRKHMSSLLESVGKRSLIEKMSFKALDESDKKVFVQAKPNVSAHERYMIDKFLNRYSKDLAYYLSKRKRKKKQREK